MEQLFTVSGTTLTMHLPAEVDHHSSEQLKTEADRMIRNHNIRCVVFDFGRTVFMDSSGIGMIIGRYKMARYMGGSAVAVRVSARMQRVLALSGIGRVIDIYGEVPQQLNLN